MKYLDYTRDIGERFYVGQKQDTLEAKIISSFTLLEEIVVKVSYDVFLPIAVALEQMQKLVQICYAPIFESTPEGDVDELRKKNAEYGESWCQRGGIGAFFMLARKADRFKTQVQKYGTLEKAIAESKHSTENILDTVGDLRRYLLLVLSWHEMKDKEREEQKPLEIPAVITAETIEDVGAQVEAQFKMQLCATCEHHKDVHNKMDSGYIICSSASCDCIGFTAKK